MVAALLACGSDAAPIPVATATLVPPPTATPLPTATPTPAPTPTPPPAEKLAEQSLVPEDATLVVDAKLAAVLSSPVVRALVNGLRGDSEGVAGLTVDFGGEFGIPLASVDYVEIFLDFEPSSGGGDGGDGRDGLAGPAFGAALRGPSVAADFVARFEFSVEGYEVEDYQGFEIYKDSSGDEESFVLSLIDADGLLLGTVDGVKAMLDVADGRAEPFAGEPVRTLDAMGSRDVGIFLKASPGQMEGLAGAGEGQLGMIGGLASGSLTAPESVGVLRFDEDVMEFVLQEFYDDEDTAASAMEFTQGSMAMLGAMLGQPGIQEILGGMEFSLDGRVVTQYLTIDAGQMDVLVDFLSGFAELAAPQS